MIQIVTNDANDANVSAVQRVLIHLDVGNCAHVI
jgi:hypothetical protein